MPSGDDMGVDFIKGNTVRGEEGRQAHCESDPAEAEWEGRVGEGVLDHLRPKEG